MKRAPFLRTAGLALLLVAGSTAAQPDDSHHGSNDADPAAQEGKLPLQELQTFADVFHQIRSGYVEEVDDSTLFEFAVRGMLEGLDPHSAYLSKEDYSDLQTTTDGEFSGLGIEIGRRGSFIDPGISKHQR